MLSELQFGSFLSYDPRPTTDDARAAKVWMYNIKTDRVLSHPMTQKPITASQYIVERLLASIGTSPLAGLLGPSKTLVPVPGSGQRVADSLWVPARVSSALVEAGLGHAVLPCLERASPVQKSASARPGQRPKARHHYESFTVQEGDLMSRPAELVLIDDVVTRGATLVGAASRLREVYPDSSITAFAIMRTLGHTAPYERLRDPVLGKITLNKFGDCDRAP